MIVQKLRVLGYTNGGRERFIVAWPDFSPPRRTGDSTRIGEGYRNLLPQLGHRSARCFLPPALLSRL